MFGGFAVAGAGAAAGGGASWLFSYNKENYGFDSGMRFGRFMASRTNAAAQVGQYREDIAGITGATVTKLNTWSGVTTLFLAVGAALSCAGRVGMHGPAPPGWYCALFSGSIFMSIMFNGTALWLSMHGALRAQCGSVSLLTRKVRLPIPSMGQIDQARVFGSSFEKQETRDIFRVPFCRHTQKGPDMPVAESQEDNKTKKKHRPDDPQYEFASTARDTVPSWVRDEAVVDKGDGFMGAGDQALHEPREAPCHFQQLMKAQEEWRDYDVYARITMLYGVVSYLYAVTYYACGTAMVELRGFWVMWTLPLVFMTAQMLIMRLDILRDGQHRLPNAEFIGHAAPFFAMTALTLEYRFFYSEASVVCAWGFALLAIFCHLVMALRMLDLAWPSDRPVADMPEEPGRQWWPGSWMVPRAFTKNLWFITPPTKLDENVAPCLLHEMEDLAAHGGGVSAGRPRKATPNPVASEDEEGPSGFSLFSGQRKHLPWQLVRIVIIVAAAQWVFIMLTTSVEIVLGPESLLKPPGEPPWIRDQKYRHWAPKTNLHLSTDSSLPVGYRLFYASKVPGSGNAVATHVAHQATETPAPEIDLDHETEPEQDVDTGDETSGEGQAHVDSPTDDHHHRRLQQKNRSDRIVSELLKMLPELGQLADKVVLAGASDRPLPAVGAPSGPSAGFMAAAAKVKDVSWPSLFEPAHLLCTAGGALALSPHGMGALLDHGAEEGAQARPFALEGLGRRDRIVGAAANSDGLLVVTSSGTLLRCAGTHDTETWQCNHQADLPTLPVSSGPVLVAAVRSQPDLQLAVIFKSMPQVAMLFRASGIAWLPTGEVHIPQAAGPRPSLSFGPGGELSIGTAAGEVHHHGPKGAIRVSPAPAVGDRGQREFRSACTASADGAVWHLTLTQAHEGSAWRPELLISS